MTGREQAVMVLLGIVCGAIEVISQNFLGWAEELEKEFRATYPVSLSKFEPGAFRIKA
jgi:hypothetical protein